MPAPQVSKNTMLVGAAKGGVQKVASPNSKPTGRINFRSSRRVAGTSARVSLNAKLDITGKQAESPVLPTRVALQELDTVA